MTQEHPITPPPELVEQWANKQDFPTFTDIATLAALAHRLEHHWNP